MTILGQDKLVVDYAADYIIMTIPAFYMNGLTETNRRWLNCFRLTYVPMIVQMITFAMHILWLYLFVVKWNM